jgi:hypothetical protein
MSNTQPKDTPTLRKPTPFIMNGDEAKFDEFPFFVQVLDRQTPGLCKITAAHCLQDVPDIPK